MNKPISVFVLTAFGLGSAAWAGWPHSSEHLTGKVKNYLMNPEGDVDGLVLQDGTQVHFPPHLSARLTAAVAKDDSVEIVGDRESAKVVRADTITNTRTNQALHDEHPAAPQGPPLPPADTARGVPPGPSGPHPGGHAGLQEMQADGTVQTQLFGPRGDVNGVILSSGTILRFGPRLLEDSKTKIEVGRKLHASGYGTQNKFGQSIEATELSNMKESK